MPRYSPIGALVGDYQLAAVDGIAKDNLIVFWRALMDAGDNLGAALEFCFIG